MAKHTITITLSEQAQRAAVLAGQPAQREQTYEVPQELVAELLELPWTDVVDEGSARCTVPTQVAYLESCLREPPGTAPDWKRSYGYGRLYLPCDVRPADTAAALATVRGLMSSVMAELDAKRAEVAVRLAEVAERDQRYAAEKAAREAAREREQSAALDAWERDHAAARAAGLPEHSGALPGFGGGHGDGAYVAQPLRPRLAALRGLLQQQDKAAEEHREAARASQRAELVRAWGDESQRARLAEGLLPDEERDALIRDRVLAPLGQHRPYERITASDLERDEDSDSDCDEGHALKCSVDAVESLTATQYERLVAIREAAAAAAKAVGGAAVVEAREHDCWCAHDGCYDRATRVGALVRVTFGELSVSKEYALD